MQLHLRPRAVSLLPYWPLPNEQSLLPLPIRLQPHRKLQGWLEAALRQLPSLPVLGVAPLLPLVLQRS
jgi:hypothetical protein